MSHPIVEAVRKAGVVGAGGAGFPTHVKLQSQVGLVIANGAECDPLLASDQRLMERHAARIVRGLRLAMEATGAERGVVALKRVYAKAVEAMQRAMAREPDISLHLMESYYPAGDEFVLVYEVTGRIIPETGLPLQVGCVVQNVGTLFHVAEAEKGAPVTHRAVTVAGEVEKPGIYWVPIGTSVAFLLERAGGLRMPLDDVGVVLGGPMMGRLTSSLDEPIRKTTSGILVLPKTTATVRALSRPLTSWVRRGRSTCDQCRDCTDLCPRHLLGHNFRPHEVMRAINYGLTDQPDIITGAVMCCECRLCEAYACPLDLSPMAAYRQIKAQLRAAGWRNERHKRWDLTPHPFREHRHVPTHRLIARLGLTAYEDQPLPFHPRALEPKEVCIPLQQHIGVPAFPVVKDG
ncbi:MAG: SLBB domain-containing protein, partial [Anaerolineae bacterium]|nr:SLBB domain-containing protein [Anaerolineae bacterium]